MKAAGQARARAGRVEAGQAGKGIEIVAARPVPRLPLFLAIGGALLIGLGIGGREFGAAGVVLALAASALVACIAAFWASVRTMIGETKLSGAEAYAIGSTGGAMEQKRAVLRALKDLEFERAVGKISEDDYRVLVARFRAQAKLLLKQIDEASAERRARAEEAVDERLRNLGLIAASSIAASSVAAEGTGDASAVDDGAPESDGAVSTSDASSDPPTNDPPTGDPATSDAPSEGEVERNA